ncbi:ABC transporter permease [Moraxella bovis]|uniref:ABC transporter permease n=1 Tax=Moraxella bovis TaxID=476 RepID=UPI00227A2F4E|nr:ABC transporter permease [Moraxella bovis]WAJ72720.1 ABC transporter permease [Moraxella bovis]
MHELVKSAVLNGLTPTVNSMLVVGLVSLPGMMTGQILAGADPTQAVRYQIVTMFLSVGAVHWRVRCRRGWWFGGFLMSVGGL